MRDSPDIVLKEFEQARAEINNRTTLSHQIVYFTIAAVGAGLTVVASHAEVLLALAFLAWWCWLVWFDHTGQIFKIALYIARPLAWRLGFKGALGWELFGRQLNERGVSKRSARGAIPRAGATSAYTPIFFGGGILALLVSYLWIARGAFAVNFETCVKLSIFALLLCLWVFAAVRTRAMLRMIRSINDEIFPVDASKPTRSGSKSRSRGHRRKLGR
jgi:hypothetical protein